MLPFALCSVIVSGCAATNTGSLARNKALLRRAYAEVRSQGNMAAGEWRAPDFGCHRIAGVE